MSEFLEIILSVLFLVDFIISIILSVILSDGYDKCPPILCQSYLWQVLDDMDINFIGKLILCILTVPFTIFYTVGVLVFKIGSFVIINMWKLFCLVFKKG